MSNVFPRHTKIAPPTAVAGDGVYLIDADGRRYLDASSGAAVSCLGHSCRPVLAAVQEQLSALAYAHSGFFTTRPAEQLAAMLAEIAPTSLRRVYFVSGGSEAVEAAIKLARQYFCERGETQRRHIIARRQSYHGNTLGALAVGGSQRRRQFEPLLSTAMHHIDPCHYWRWGAADESEEEYGRRVADQLEEKILELGADTVAAFVAEPVVGATMGAVPAATGYFRRIAEICRHYRVLFIADEVMCGMGRTGDWFAVLQENIPADIVCIAKGLGAGVQPVGALLASEEIYAAIAGGSGFFQHGHTYMGHPAACAAGVAVLREIKRRRLLHNVRDQGEKLLRLLRDRFHRHPHVGDIRGRGLLLGMELVADKDGKTPFPAAAQTHAAVKKTAFANGLLVYPMGGTIDGQSGDHILIAPPFIVEDRHLDEIADKMALTLRLVFNQ